MNKAFVREPDTTADYCPRCGAQGQPVGREAMRRYVPPRAASHGVRSGRLLPHADVRGGLLRRLRADDSRGRPRAARLSQRPRRPDLRRFGLTRRDIEQDVSEGVVTRVRAILDKSKTPAARCADMSANGQCCVAYVQKYYMQCREGKG